MRSKSINKLISVVFILIDASLSCFTFFVPFIFPIFFCRQLFSCPASTRERKKKQKTKKYAYICIGWILYHIQCRRYTYYVLYKSINFFSVYNIIQHVTLSVYCVLIIYFADGKYPFIDKNPLVIRRAIISKILVPYIKCLHLEK